MVATTNFALALPLAGDALWNNTLNANFSAIDAALTDIRGGVTLPGIAAGTADALSANFVPAYTTIVNGQILTVKAAAANVTATPTFAPNAIAAAQIVKGNNLPLNVGDIAGAGHWLQLQWDAALSKWVLLNPAGAPVAGNLAQPFSVAAPTANGHAVRIVGYANFSVSAGVLTVHKQVGMTLVRSAAGTFPFAFTVIQPDANWTYSVGQYRSTTWASSGINVGAKTTTSGILTLVENSVGTDPQAGAAIASSIIVFAS